MKINPLAKRYAALNPAAQARCLARLACQLTIEARGTYIPQTEAIADPTRLRRMNELQHRITAQLSHVLGNAERYPDLVFIEIVMEMAMGAECDRELAKTLDDVISEFENSNVTRRPRRIAS